MRRLLIATLTSTFSSAGSSNGRCRSKAATRPSKDIATNNLQCRRSFNLSIYNFDLLGLAFFKYLYLGLIKLLE